MQIPAKIGRLFAWLEASYPNAGYSQAAPAVWARELDRFTETELLAGARRCLVRNTGAAPNLGDMVKALRDEIEERNTVHRWEAADKALPPVDDIVGPGIFAMYQARCDATDRARGIAPPPRKIDKTRDDYDFGGKLGGITRGELMARIAKAREGIS